MGFHDDEPPAPGVQTHAVRVCGNRGGPHANGAVRIDADHRRGAVLPRTRHVAHPGSIEGKHVRGVKVRAAGSARVHLERTRSRVDAHDLPVPLVAGVDPSPPVDRQAEHRAAGDGNDLHIPTQRHGIDLPALPARVHPPIERVPAHAFRMVQASRELLEHGVHPTARVMAPSRITNARARSSTGMTSEG